MADFRLGGGQAIESRHHKKATGTENEEESRLVKERKEAERHSYVCHLLLHKSFLK